MGLHLQSAGPCHRSSVFEYSLHDFPAALVMVPLAIQLLRDDCETWQLYKTLKSMRSTVVLDLNAFPHTGESRPAMPGLCWCLALMSTDRTGVMH